MFGRKQKNRTDDTGAGEKTALSVDAKPAEAKAETPKEKKSSPRDVLIKKIEQLSSGERICYQLPAMYGGDVVIIELNQGYPAKGRKYAVVSADLVDGKPGEKRRTLWDTDKPKVIADWILEKNAQLMG
jgi:hypothetical protein